MSGSDSLCTRVTKNNFIAGLELHSRTLHSRINTKWATSICHQRRGFSPDGKQCETGKNSRGQRPVPLKDDVIVFFHIMIFRHKFFRFWVRACFVSDWVSHAKGHGFESVAHVRIGDQKVLMITEGPCCWCGLKTRYMLTHRGRNTMSEPFVSSFHELSRE